MMTPLLLTVLLTADAPSQDPPPTPEAAGEVAFMAGVCQGVGFDLDREAVMAIGHASATVEPGVEAWRRRHQAGVAGLEASMMAEVDAVNASGDSSKAHAWARSVVVRCDELAARWPGVVSRSAAADARIDDWLGAFDDE